MWHLCVCVYCGVYIQCSVYCGVYIQCISSSVYTGVYVFIHTCICVWWDV